MTMLEQFPPPVDPIPPDPGDGSKTVGTDAYKAWHALAVARKNWIIRKRQSIVAKAVDDIMEKAGDWSPTEAICFVIGAAFLDGSIGQAPGSAFDKLFGGLL